MSGCNFPEELLHAFLDGEAGAHGERVEAHLRSCDSCSQRLAAARDSAESLRQLIDDAVGQVEPLEALRGIRQRIEARARLSLAARLSSFWDDLWAYHRRAVAGVMVAASLGALTAPAVVLWARRTIQQGGAGASFASVMIESMEWDGETQAVVYTSEDSHTTLIWVTPDDADHEP